MSATKEKPTGLALLREPFAPNQINQLPKQMKRDDQDRGKCERGSRYSADGVFCGGYHARSLHLDFVGHAALTDRLLDADDEWSWEPCAWGPDGLPAFDKLGGLWIRLTVCGVTRLGYGDAQGKTGPNAVKEAIGDALRNAGMRFGAALDLWHKGDLHDARGEQEPVERKAERVQGPSEDQWTAPLPPDAPKVTAAELLLQAENALTVPALLDVWAARKGVVSPEEEATLKDIIRARKADLEQPPEPPADATPVAAPPAEPGNGWSDVEVAKPGSGRKKPAEANA